jgi:hypothetical protein
MAAPDRVRFVCDCCASPAEVLSRLAAFTKDGDAYVACPVCGCPAYFGKFLCPDQEAASTTWRQPALNGRSKQAASPSCSPSSS